MNPFRISLALAALLITPSSALADLRSPVVGETSTLSTLIPTSRTEAPAIATDGATQYVTYLESTGGVAFHRIAAGGTEISAPRPLSAPDAIPTDRPKIAVSGQHVYVAWIQSSARAAQSHAVVAASHDGGRTFAMPVQAGRLTGTGAWDVELAADDEHVFVAFADSRDRVWAAGSRDGGRTFPCVAVLTQPGDEVDGGGQYSLAVDGDAIVWSWLTEDFDVMVRRSRDGGRTLEPEQEVFDSPGRHVYPGVPRVAADGGLTAIAISRQTAVPRPDGTGTDAAWTPLVLTSTDGGAAWGTTEVAELESRCVGTSCAGPYALDVDGGHIYVGWRANGSMWLAKSNGIVFGRPQALGGYAYTWSAADQPDVAAHGDTVVATWHTAPRPDSFDLDPVAALSTNGGRTFALRTVNADAGQDLQPVAAPSGEGAGVAWWSRDPTPSTGDTHVEFAPLAPGEPDITVEDVQPFQVAVGADRLVAGRPTTIRAQLRLGGPRKVLARVETKVVADGATRTVRTNHVLRPGLNVVQLLADQPLTAKAGRLEATVQASPNNDVDADWSDNHGEGARDVVATRPLKVLFVPVTDGASAPPSCRDVRDVADGAQEHLRAAWPLDPDKVQVVTACGAPLTHPTGLTDEGLMGSGMLMARLDRLKWTAKDIDKVVGVVAQGWFARQLIEGFDQAVGAAPIGGGYDTAIVERQNVGGWVVGHELAHNFGREHRNDTPAPGYWVTKRRDVPGTTLDLLHFNVAGASVSDPDGRWLSKPTWDELTLTLQAPEQVTRSAAADDTLSFTGSVSAGGTLTAGPAFERPGTPDATDGPYTLEQLAADGTVLQTQAFGAATDLGPVGTATAKPDLHVQSAVGGFSLRVPALPAARTLRVRKAGEVLLTRARSAAAPVVSVATPARVQVGDDLELTWTASDADGDALTSLVELSLDDGETWQPVGDATAATERTIKATAELGGAELRVRVVTSDGWNTAVATSERFVVGGELSDGAVVFTGFGGKGAYSVELDGSRRRAIAGSPSMPRWSPDGTRLVLNSGVNVFTSRGDGTGLRQVTTNASGHKYNGATWMPDGDRILVHKDAPGEFGYVTVDPETGAETPLAYKPLNVCGLTRDGSRLIAYHSGSSWLYRTDGSDGVNLGIPSHECVSLSPDGRYAAASYRLDPQRSVSDLVIWDLPTKTMRNLTQGRFGRYNTDPVWSPTGEWIVWSSTKDRGVRDDDWSSADLWKIRPDGTDATKIVSGRPAEHLENADIQPRRGALPPDLGPALQERTPEAVLAEAPEGVEGTPVTLDASGSTPGASDTPIVAYGWDLDGDGRYTDATGAKPTATFTDEGTYTVRVQVTDAHGHTSTASGEVHVENAPPTIRDARLSATGVLTAQVTDLGVLDSPTGTVYWNGSEDGEAVSLAAVADGRHAVSLSRAGATSARLVISDGDGLRDDVEAEHVAAPVNAAPTAADATAQVVAGESVDVDLPGRDPDGEAVELEIVAEPAHGQLSRRVQAPRVTYTAGAEPGTDTFTYRVRNASGESSTATVTVTVTPRPAEGEGDDDQGGAVFERPLDPPLPDRPRPTREGTSPAAAGRGDDGSQTAGTAPTKVDQVLTLPSVKRCVSRRAFTIRIKRGQYRQITVHVNGKRVKVLRGVRDTARVDLRGLPKGRFKVTIAVTLDSGKVLKSTRRYRTCTPKAKKGARS